MRSLLPRTHFISFQTNLSKGQPRQNWQVSWLVSLPPVDPSSPVLVRKVVTVLDGVRFDLVG
jgi:hypothetical protein